MKSHTQKECLEIFEKADVTVGAVADIEQLSSHPYIIERGSLVNLPDRDVMSGVLPATQLYQDCQKRSKMKVRHQILVKIMKQYFGKLGFQNLI